MTSILFLLNLILFSFSNCFKILEMTTREVFKSSATSLCLISKLVEALSFTLSIKYLKEKEYIFGEIEDLTLSKMQGVEGLRALRVSVAIN